MVASRVPNIDNPAERSRLLKKKILRTPESARFVDPRTPKRIVTMEQFKAERAIIRRIAKHDYNLTRSKKRIEAQLKLATENRPLRHFDQNPLPSV